MAYLSGNIKENRKYKKNYDKSTKNLSLLKNGYRYKIRQFQKKWYCFPVLYKRWNRWNLPEAISKILYWSKKSINWKRNKKYGYKNTANNWLKQAYLILRKYLSFYKKPNKPNSRWKDTMNYRKCLLHYFLKSWQKRNYL